MNYNETCGDCDPCLGGRPDQCAIGPRRMKALSLWQPWASAMANGFKTIETRSWATSYRGDLLICSAKRKPKRDELPDERDYQEALTLPYGGALCVVELFDILPTEQITRNHREVYEPEADLGDYTPGRFGWMTRNLRVLKAAFPISGHQGLWNVGESFRNFVLSNVK